MAAFLITLLVAVFGLIIWGRRTIRKTIERHETIRREQVIGERCRCGYPMKELDMGRCPECGRVINFDATPEQLGLTHDQLSRIAEKRRNRANPSDHHARD